MCENVRSMYVHTWQPIRIHNKCVKMYENMKHDNTLRETYIDIWNCARLYADVRKRKSLCEHMRTCFTTTMKRVGTKVCDHIGICCVALQPMNM